MRFNNLYLQDGDSREEIIRKINSNFSQVISFSSGPKGRLGEIGPTGYPGAAGPKGITGATGDLPSIWTSGSSQPSEAKNYDYWINQSASGQGEVYEYQSGWSSTGFSFLESDYFSVKWDIPSSGGTSDYSAIYLSGDDPASRALVISDYGLTADSVNPNYSKFLITTLDQISKPILSFRNTSSSGLNQPSFYWGATGNYFPLVFSSDYDFSIKAGGSASSYNGGLLLGMGETGNINFTGNNFTLSNRNSPTLLSNSSIDGKINIDAGRYFLVNSSEWGLTESSFDLKGDVVFGIYGDIVISPSASLNQPEGMVFSYGLPPATGNQDRHRIITLGYWANNSYPDLYINSNFVLVVKSVTDPTVGGSEERSGVSFGVTGGEGPIYSFYSGYPTSATGPRAYHVSGVQNYEFKGSVEFYYLSYTGIIPSGNYYYGELQRSTFSRDVIRITIPTTFPGGNDVFVKIPLLPEPVPDTDEPFYGPNYCYEYKIVMSDQNLFSNKKIRGIVYESTAGGAITNLQYMVFTNSCHYIDLIYFYDESLQKIKVYIKTCKGESYIVNQ